MTKKCPLLYSIVLCCFSLSIFIASSASADTIDYLIITSAAIKTSHAFKPLINAKAARGLSIAIESVENIVQNFPGKDPQEKIRNFIKQKHTHSGLTWVLLGGDASIVPVRTMAVPNQGKTPSDMYYSCLKGTWDANGNNIFGEFEDAVNFYPDVYVGRAPVKDANEAMIFANKVIAYETNARHYANKILLLGSNNFDDFGGRMNDLITNKYMPAGLNITAYYERNIPGYHDLTITALNAGQNIVNHMDHGSPDNLRLGADWLTISDVDNLTNASTPAILVTSACSPAPLDQDSIARHWLLNPHGGGAAFIGSSKYAPYPEVDEALLPAFYESLLHKKITHIGQTLADAKITFINDADVSSDIRWGMYELNLFGDPEMPIQINGGVNLNITSPQATGYVRGKVPIYGSAFLNQGFKRYELSYALKDSPGTTTLITSSFIPIENGLLNPNSLWDTTKCRDGKYLLVLKLFATDGKIINFDHPLEVTVDNIHQPPEFVHLKNRGAVINRLLKFRVQVSDPDDPATPWGQVRVSAANPPPGALFNPDTQVFSWQPSVQQQGTYRATFTAKDPASTVSKTIILSTVDVEESLITSYQPNTYLNDPGINGNKVVWVDQVQGNGHNNVHWYDLAEKKEITTISADFGNHPFAGDTSLSWRENKNGIEMVYTYDISSGQKIFLKTLSPGQDYGIFDDKVAHVESHATSNAIAVINLLTGDKKVFADTTGNKMTPQISGNKVVWMDKRNGNWDIYLYDLASGQETPIAVDPAIQQNPFISHNRIVWADSRNGGSDIYLFDLSTGKETRITDGQSEHTYPVIDGDRIIWRNDGSDIIMYDLSTGLETQLTDGRTTSDHRLSGNSIVWRDYLYDEDKIALRAARMTFQDVIPPALTVTAPQPGTDYAGAFDISGSVIDNVSTIKFVCFSLDHSNPIQIPVVAGKFSYHADHIASGARIVTISAYDDAHNETRKEISIVIKNPAGQIQGRIYQASWPGYVSGAVITARSIDKASFLQKITSDQNGCYSLKNFPNGWYMITVIKSGYLAQSRSIFIASGKTTPTNFFLLKNSH
ncbi:MAG: C25 family cysteine peptidase [Candidatus Omnitrophota bacterium]